MQTTYEEIMNMFRETAAISKEAAERSRETDAQIKEILQELLQSQKKTDEKFRETNDKFRETAQQFSETDRKIKELNTLFTSQWGKLIESLVAGDLVNLLNQRGIAVNDTVMRLKGKQPNGDQYEFDIIAHNGDEIVVVEVKTTLRPNDVKDFIEKLQNFKTWVPLYANKTVYGAMAWLTADAGAETMVMKRYFFSIRATGDAAQIVNPPDFVPYGW